ncbi:acyl-CoA N-acyltransferase [Rhizophagus irregularis]|uniref:Acyl-CoA N-acyltransferase n=1 Tax=Rhizophagus irregularis TaxID=588596 RepID=A0A2N0NXC4_9GLOM|nr:acyl-CoA N-acyltransferase [Rhizophagus irregularis]
MSELRRFRTTDLFRFNNYNISFYLTYLARWPDLFCVQESPSGTIMGYIMGKAEGRNKDWHGHVTAITVAPEYRRLGLADGMMKLLENVSEKIYDGYFVDLFVRVSNKVAIGMYKKFGYSVFRRVNGYYSSGDNNEEDAFDMRKPLPRDEKRESVIENGENNIVKPEDL